MRITRAEVRWVRIPLVAPFRTSFGTSYDRDTIVLRLVTDAGVEGWSECGAELDPLYSEEWLAGVELVVRDHLLPRLVALGDGLTAAAVKPALEPVKRHFMAKHLLETAVLDAELRSAGMPFATFLGSVKSRVPAGVSVGIMESTADLLGAVAGYLEAATCGSNSRSSPAGTWSRCGWCARSSATSCCRSMPTRPTP
jgi:O-succinylbenzoate synthase